MTLTAAKMIDVGCMWGPKDRDQSGEHNTGFMDFPNHPPQVAESRSASADFFCVTSSSVYPSRTEKNASFAWVSGVRRPQAGRMAQLGALPKHSATGSSAMTDRKTAPIEMSVAGRASRSPPPRPRSEVTKPPRTNSVATLAMWCCDKP
jgi:hypothetical protein